MDKVRLAFVSLTIIIIVLPILGIVLVYRDNLLGLLIPPEINDAMRGLRGGSEANGQSQTDQTSAIDEFIDAFVSNGTIPDAVSEILTEPPDIQYDPVTRTFTASFQMKNPIPMNITLKSLNGTVECDEHKFPIGPVTLKKPVNLTSGENATVTIVGRWTEAATNHLNTAHSGEQNIKASLVGGFITYTSAMFGGSYAFPEAVSLGEIPLTGD